METAKPKCKSEGIKHCCYGTCNSDTRYRSREDMNGVFFIPFPKPITQGEKCVKWIKACGRQNFNIKKIKRCTYICSKHFVGGKGPTTDHPDPIPALLHTDEQVRTSSFSYSTCRPSVLFTRSMLISKTIINLSMPSQPLQLIYCSINPL